MLKRRPALEGLTSPVQVFTSQTGLTAWQRELEFSGQPAQEPALLRRLGWRLCSAGHNRIVNSALGELHAINANPVAKNNWWGGGTPRVVLSGDASSFDGDPALETDPRSE